MVSSDIKSIIGSSGSAVDDQVSRCEREFVPKSTFGMKKLSGFCSSIRSFFTGWLGCTSYNITH
ncbi:MAG: hypothetical protein GY870_16360 [archaeon]|nr:hypothetical protein [archaeon]